METGEAKPFKEFQTPLGKRRFGKRTQKKSIIGPEWVWKKGNYGP